MNEIPSIQCVLSVVLQLLLNVIEHIQNLTKHWKINEGINYKEKPAVMSEVTVKWKMRIKRCYSVSPMDPHFPGYGGLSKFTHKQNYRHYGKSPQFAAQNTIVIKKKCKKTYTKFKFNADDSERDFNIPTKLQWTPNSQSENAISQCLKFRLNHIKYTLCFHWI